MRNPLGQHHQGLSHYSRLLCLSSLDTFLKDTFWLDQALTVDYTVEHYPQREVIYENHPDDYR